MADKKVVFVAFAIEDERQRDLLKGQSLNTNSPFEYIDMSVKEPYDSNWKDRVRTRIRRSDGVIALVSKNSLKSNGQKWEISCAKDENKKALLASIPLGRLGDPSEIAHAVSFLATDGAAYISGETLHVNGGMFMP